MYSLYFISKNKHNFYIVYNIMGKRNTFNLKKYILPFNILVIIGLFCAYQYYDKKVNDFDEFALIEGVRNTNCCGGIEGGVHYQETDTKPPDYIRRCFRSRRDNGEVVYEWSGFPCTNKDSSECCQNSDGTDLGECVASSGGGYCESDNNRRTFRRGKATSSPYIKRSNDKILDVNNTIDMEDYFYERKEARREKRLSPDMLEFLKRKDKNTAFIQSHIVDRNREKIQRETEAKLKASEKQKIIQIKDTILAVHLLFVLGFAFLVKDLMIKEIDGFYDMLQVKLLEFRGKTVSQ
jgi:hypothetical protein